MPLRKGRIHDEVVVAGVPEVGAAAAAAGDGVEFGIGVGSREEEEKEEDDEEEPPPPAWRRTLRMSSGLPMTMPMAPETYPAQKSADIMVPLRCVPYHGTAAVGPFEV